MIFQTQTQTFLYDNFEISLVVFMPNITTNHAITYTNKNNDLEVAHPQSGSLSTLFLVELEFGPGPHWWEASALTTAPSLAPCAIPCTPNYWFMIPEKPHRR